MSRSKRLTRDRYIAGMFAALDEGHYDISLTDLCRGLGVTTGSFYSHFGQTPDLHLAVIEIWRRDRIAALPDASGDEVRDPLDSLRQIRLAAEMAAGRDATIRRWAATAKAPGFAIADQAPAWMRTAPAAAAAVAEVDQIITDHLTRAFTDLGFIDREPADLACWLAAGLQSEDRARDEKGFETVVGVCVRAEAFSLQGPEVTTAAGPDATRIYATARTLPADARRALGEVARLLAAGRSADQAEPDDDCAEAGQG